MMSTLLLSIDSVFAGATFRFVAGAETRRFRRYAASMMALADSTALLLGRTLHGLISPRLDHRQLLLLTACCTVMTVLLGRSWERLPRRTILAMAALFSIDNLLAGAGSPDLLSVILQAPGCALSSGLAFFIGIRLAEPIAKRVRTDLSLAFGALATGICFSSL